MAQNFKDKSKKSNASTMAELTRTVNHKQIDEWGRFIEINEEQKSTRSKDKGIQVWVDKELKEKLDQMKVNGLHYPTRYMLNAALKVFFESNADEISKYVK